MVPVLNVDKIPLMPCSEKRARQLMEKGKAIPYHQKGFFCIKLLEQPDKITYQPVALGIDIGSKREGYSVLTEEAVCLNLLTDTPDWVKDRIISRRLLRHRRRKKTPHRSNRANRAVLRKENRIPPSTLAYWGARLRVVKVLLKLFPITIINVEDIKATPKENNSATNKKYNNSFSPLEIGKNWFYNEIKKLVIDVMLTQGWETANYRNKREFVKLPKGEKLLDKWEAHNIDSHCLAEIALGKEIKPFKQLWKLNFYQFRRRSLHLQNPVKKGLRRRHGGTTSLGLPKGAIVKYENKLCYIGGNSKNKLSVHDLKSKKRISKYATLQEIKVIYLTSWRIQFL